MEYLKNQYRRFTFFWEMDHKEPIEPFFKSNVTTLNDSGILSLEEYYKENQNFFVVDALPNVNYTHIRKVLDNLLSSKESRTDKNQNSPLETGPLERIYELEQKKIYHAQEGQLKTKTETHKRFVWTLLLEEKTELMEEYRRVHSIGQAWPQITKNMKQVGVKDMEIYLHANQAILIMDTKPNFDLEKVAPVWQSLPRENEWQAYVAKFQKVDPLSKTTEKWQTMISK